MDADSNFAGSVLATGSRIVIKQVIYWSKIIKTYNSMKNKGGFYKCNKYENMSTDEKDSKKKEFDKEKSMLEKYSFYFERFNNN